MNVKYFQAHELPMQDLETMGLASRGQVLLNEDDLNALLYGRRTEMLTLQNLEAENIKIKSIDAKLSLERNANGKVSVLIHPIYNRPVIPPFLEENEARELIKGDTHMLWKMIKEPKGDKELLVEYDAETREFVISDVEQITAPDMVNNEYLTAAQKENYRKGKEVKLPDGTTFQHSGKDVNGIRANRMMLIASVLIDGGLSYMVYKALHALSGKKRDEQEAKTESPGFKAAMQDALEQRLEDSRDLSDERGQGVKY